MFKKKRQISIYLLSTVWFTCDFKIHFITYFPYYCFITFFYYLSDEISWFVAFKTNAEYDKKGYEYTFIANKCENF